MLKKSIYLMIIFMITFTACFSGDDDENDNIILDTTPPEVVSTSPERGTSGVDKSITQLSVTFNEEMANGYSFGILSSYPFPGYNIADPENSWSLSWSSDKKTITATFMVPLDPNTEYGVSINSAQFSNFRDLAGNTLVPVEWRFTTGN